MSRVQKQHLKVRLVSGTNQRLLNIAHSNEGEWVECQIKGGPMGVGEGGVGDAMGMGEDPHRAVGVAVQREKEEPHDLLGEGGWGCDGGGGYVCDRRGREKGTPN